MILWGSLYLNDIVGLLVCEWYFGWGFYLNEIGGLLVCEEYCGAACICSDCPLYVLYKTML